MITNKILASMSFLNCLTFESIWAAMCGFQRWQTSVSFSLRASWFGPRLFAAPCRLLVGVAGPHRSDPAGPSRLEPRVSLRHWFRFRCPMSPSPPTHTLPHTTPAHTTHTPSSHGGLSKHWEIFARGSADESSIPQKSARFFSCFGVWGS